MWIVIASAQSLHGLTSNESMKQACIVVPGMVAVIANAKP